MAIEALEKGACKDIQVAKLTLGLYAIICRMPEEDLFPGYKWANTDIWRFPQGLRPCVKSVLQWSSGKRVVLNALLLSRLQIIAATESRLRRTPHSRRRRKIADMLRQKYPYLKAEVAKVNDALTEAKVLGDMVGQPISEDIILLMRACGSGRPEIRRHSDPWSYPHAAGAMSVRLGADGYTVKSISMTVAAPALRGKPKVVDGLLGEYFATGTEGLQWIIEDFDGLGFEKLHWIEAGDHLTIQDRLGLKLWSGEIKCDRKAGWKPYPMNPKYGQPCALGYWIHWTQKGFKPEKWAQLFVRSGHDRLYGILTRKSATVASRHSTCASGE